MSLNPEQERAAITAAMTRLLSGTPLRTSGNLDIVTLAAEAGLKRHHLTHKHKDLKDLFYAQVKAQSGVPDRERKLREEIDALKAKVESLRAERDDYRVASEVFARAMNVLTVENNNLRKELAKARSATVRPFTPPVPR
jgi:molybdopterin converting factor small subunit